MCVCVEVYLRLCPRLRPRPSPLQSKRGGDPFAPTPLSLTLTLTLTRAGGCRRETGDERQEMQEVEARGGEEPHVHMHMHMYVVVL